MTVDHQRCLGQRERSWLLNNVKPFIRRHSSAVVYADGVLVGSQGLQYGDKAKCLKALQRIHGDHSLISEAAIPVNHEPRAGRSVLKLRLKNDVHIVTFPPQYSNKLQCLSHLNLGFKQLNRILLLRTIEETKSMTKPD